MQNNIINNLRLTAVSMIENAKSGHPGIALGIAPTLFSLYANHLNVVPKQPNHILRDRFVLSAGHGSSVLYCTLSAMGYDISAKDLKTFRKINSKLTGLPHITVPGIDCTTGPLGQGVAIAVGMALAEKMLAEKFNKPDCKLFDNYTYTLVGEGCLMEGVSYEALSLAGALKLNKLIVLYDCNNITIEGNTTDVFEVDIAKFMQSLGYNVITVTDANNLQQINSAITLAKKCQDKPSFIILHSIIGYGSYMQGLAKVHGTPLGEKGINQLKKNLNYKGTAFEFSDDESLYLKKVKDRFALVEQNLNKKLSYYKTSYKADYKNLYKYLNQNYKDVESILKNFYVSGDLSLREAANKIINKLSEYYLNIVCGSADVAPSTMCKLDAENVTKKHFLGKNIRFGVREFAMSCICNGLALYGGFRPICSTFLAFADYLHNGLRSSAIMNLPVTYIFTHDSIAIGEDGITHQPIEQLFTYRNIPNVNLYRPADFNECKACFINAFKQQKPSIFVLCKQAVENLNSPTDKALKGGYVILKENKPNIDAILIATGSEVQLALNSAHALQKMGYSIRVVSMPCTNIFDEQNITYKNMVLPPNITKRVSIELANEGGWHKYIGLNGLHIGVEKFGESGDSTQLLKKYGFTEKQITKKIIKYLSKNF